MGGNEKKKRMSPTGPYAPPNPSEADQDGPEPMAVANDKRTPHDAFMPTTAHMSRGQRERPRDENRRAERPRGYSEPDVMGFRHPDEDEPGGAPGTDGRPSRSWARTKTRAEARSALEER